MASRNKTALRSTDQLMRELVLLHNDPALADEFYIYAIQGSVDAQYALGLIYAEGRGVEEDLVKSFAWLTVCSISGDEDALILRQVVSERMDDNEFQESLDLSKAIYAPEGHISTLVIVPTTNHADDVATIQKILNKTVMIKIVFFIFFNPPNI